MNGIRVLPPTQEKQAERLQELRLEHCVAWLEREGQRASEAEDYGLLLRCWRDRALILLGFWRAFQAYLDGVEVAGLAHGTCTAGSTAGDSGRTRRCAPTA